MVVILTRPKGRVFFAASILSVLLWRLCGAFVWLLWRSFLRVARLTDSADEFLAVPTADTLTHNGRLSPAVSGSCLNDRASVSDPHEAAKRTPSIIKKGSHL